LRGRGIVKAAWLIRVVATHSAHHSHSGQWPWHPNKQFTRIVRPAITLFLICDEKGFDKPSFLTKSSIRPDCLFESLFCYPLSSKSRMRDVTYFLRSVFGVFVGQLAARSHSRPRWNNMIRRIPSTSAPSMQSLTILRQPTGGRGPVACAN